MSLAAFGLMAPSLHGCFHSPFFPTTPFRQSVACGLAMTPERAMCRPCSHAAVMLYPHHCPTPACCPTQMVCQATTANDERIRIAAFSCLHEIAANYYAKLPAYITEIFKISVKAIQEDNEDVGLQVGFTCCFRAAWLDGRLGQQLACFALCQFYSIAACGVLYTAWMPSALLTFRARFTG